MQKFINLSGVIPMIHIKIDMGGRRAGVIRGSNLFNEVVKESLSQHKAGHIKLCGLYSHAGHSYGGDSQIAAMAMLRDELVALQAASEDISRAFQSPFSPLILSVGATPTALSIQNIVDNSPPEQSEVKSAADDLQSLIKNIKATKNIVEIHAGVYPTLDLQQLAAHSLSTSLLSWSDIAFTVLAEVLSVYPSRGEHSTPEALIGAGGLALGREFCKAYPGMAMLTPWNRQTEMPRCDVEQHKGWIVGRFAQEHGILTWTGEPSAVDELEVSQKVRLWPNHACITGSHFGWYFVVDSSRKGKEDEIVDIWTKARGW
jgi:D-serine deaminase-like pyridoxal phosphate-dependent protein